MRRIEESIYFKESSLEAADFLHELSDPGLVRPRSLSPGVMVQLRREQIARLKQNIAVLRRKQEEFNRKMEEYIGNLRSLMESLGAQPEGRSETVLSGSPGTRVRCARCASERVFEGLHVIFARESDKSLDGPTQCYVSHGGRIKKGMFRCRECGGGSLTIRAETS